MPKKRPLGVLVIGVYLIIQAVFSLVHYSELGSIALFLAGTFAVIGVGLFKGSKGAFYATILVSALLLVMGLLIYFRIEGSSNIAIPSIIVGGLIIFYLSGKGARDFFFA